MCVFPACAGMFLCHRWGSSLGWCFPRVRGDVPALGQTAPSHGRFSPRARGCSHHTRHQPRYVDVFPACAGMFPAPPKSGRIRQCFPRVRGDVPVFCFPLMWMLTFSPRARGCSSNDSSNARWCAVFPACAGMFPDNFSTPPPSYRFPRVRGDVPGVTDSVVDKIKFSPRARGCSAARIRVLPGCGVFPACAGMFPAGTALRLNPCRFPRVRGDVPNALARQQQARLFSPRARGCSLHDDHPFCVCVVFPACAGMFLPRRGLGLSGSGFPRVRGDVPVTGLPTRLSALFSPRARGCS